MRFHDFDRWLSRVFWSPDDAAGGGAASGDDTAVAGGDAAAGGGDSFGSDPNAGGGAAAGGSAPSTSTPAPSGGGQPAAGGSPAAAAQVVAQAQAAGASGPQIRDLLKRMGFDYQDDLALYNDIMTMRNNQSSLVQQLQNLEAQLQRLSQQPQQQPAAAPAGPPPVNKFLAPHQLTWEKYLKIMGRNAETGEFEPHPGASQSQIDQAREFYDWHTQNSNGFFHRPQEHIAGMGFVREDSVQKMLQDLREEVLSHIGNEFQGRQIYQQLSTAATEAYEQFKDDPESAWTFKKLQKELEDGGMDGALSIKIAEELTKARIASQRSGTASAAATVRSNAGLPAAPELTPAITSGPQRSSAGAPGNDPQAVPSLLDVFRNHGPEIRNWSAGMAK